jgi:4-carboxymuconolactone decarboxylase
VPMNQTADIAEFSRYVSSFQPQEYACTRRLAMYAAAIAVGDNDVMVRAIRKARDQKIRYRELYEVVLQSYLFLGFPRMLNAADVLHETLKNTREGGTEASALDGDLGNWRKRGQELCRHVYGDAFEALRNRVKPMAPEIFDWMIFEGYGKVLSRPGLSIVNRELAIVAFLIVENQPRQLYSHMRGALNVGASTQVLRLVIEDLSRSFVPGYRSACKILQQLGVV